MSNSGFCKFKTSKRHPIRDKGLQAVVNITLEGMMAACGLLLFEEFKRQVSHKFSFHQF